MSEDLAIEAVLELMNGIESGIASARQRIKEKKLPEENLNFDTLFWEEKKGEKGAFQQTSEKANQNSILWQQLKAKLKEHQGFWQNSGFRYWFDLKNENIIDRRKIG